MITAVMPTSYVRRHFWFSAIHNFTRQTFEDSELLILDESPSRAEGEWPDRVRYVWMPPEGLSTGAKRNRVNELAEGELIAHWDDDDWHHPGRLGDQVAFMFATGKPVVGYHDCLYLRLPQRDLWRYRFPGRGPYATGTSLFYRRDWWESNRFNDTDVGEDSALWGAACGQRAIESTESRGMIVARAHPGNTFKPDFGNNPFLKASKEDFPELFLAEANL